MKNVLTLLAVITCFSTSKAQVKFPKKTKVDVSKSTKLKKVESISSSDLKKIDNDYSEEYATIYAFNNASACSDDLVDDGCSFISGTGRDMSIDYRIINILNNCRVLDLPSYYVWDGNQTQTRYITVDYNNCCYSYDVMNYKVNSIVGSAMGVRPYRYLVTNYRRVNGQQVTTYGPYRVRIEVTYRKVKSKLTAFNQFQVKEN